MSDAADAPHTRWFKSRRSGNTDNCVEVNLGLGGGVGVRDTKDSQGPALVVAPADWASFVAAVKCGDLVG